MTALRYHAVVIEDDPQIRRFLRTVLPSEGFEVFEAETAERGLVEAATQKPDVIILDLGLPDLDGAEVIRRLREWSHVPILVLSARTREQDKIAALVKHAGMVATHRQLLRDVWGSAHVEHAHTLRVHMAALRRKLEADPARPRYLLTEIGVGYRPAAE